MVDKETLDLEKSSSVSASQTLVSMAKVEAPPATDAEEKTDVGLIEHLVCNEGLSSLSRQRYCGLLAAAGGGKW